jgi:hypothetical protein
VERETAIYVVRTIVGEVLGAHREIRRLLFYAWMEYDDAQNRGATAGPDDGVVPCRPFKQCSERNLPCERISRGQVQMKKHVRTTDFDLVYVPASVTRGASQPSHIGRFSGKWDAWDGYGVTLAGNHTRLLERPMMQQAKKKARR